MIPLTYKDIAKVEFDTTYNEAVELRIKKYTPGAAIPTVKSLIATGDPITINMLGKGNATHDNIKTTEAILNVNNIENFQALNLLADSNRQYILQVLYKNTTVWTGFMIPDQWSEPFIGVPYPSNFTFVDGFALLKNEKFVGADGKYMRGRWKMYKIIGHCLNKIGMHRNFVDQINIIDQQTETPQGTMAEKWFDLEAFRDMNCYEVVQGIIRSFNSRLEFRNNKYYFRRINDPLNSRPSIEYDSDYNTTEYMEDVSVAFTNAQAETSDRVVFLEVTQELRRLPGWKSYIYKQDYGRKESIIPRSDFSDPDNWTEDGVLKEWDMLSVVKHEIDNEIYARYLPYIVTVPYLQKYTDDKYSIVNIKDNPDTFEFTNTQRNIDYKGREGGYYYGPRGGQREFISVPISNIPIRIQYWWQDQRKKFRLHKDDIDFRYDGYEGDKIIFKETDNVPPGVKPGVVYTMINVQNFTNIIVFDITHGELTPFIRIDLSDAEDGKKYQCDFRFSYIPSVCGLKINTEYFNISMSEEFQRNANVDLNIRDLNTKEDYSVSCEAILELPEILEDKTYPAPIFVKIGKIRDSSEDQMSRTQREAWWAMKSIALTINDTPEYLEEEVKLNPDNNQTGSVDIMFAETPIKNNFLNNKLKFFNNFFSYSLDTPPGEQWINTGIFFKITLTIVGNGCVWVGNDLYCENAVINVGDRGDLYTLKHIQQSMYRGLYKKPRLALTGNMDSPDINILGKNAIDSYTGKSYILTGCSWNMRKHRYDGEWHEVNIAPDTARLGSFSNAFSTAFDLYLPLGLPEGVNVLLRAIVDAGSEFIEWSGDVTGTADTKEFIITEDMAITATFQEVPKTTLTLQVTGSGYVQVNDGEIYGVGTVTLEFYDNEEITLKTIKRWNDVDFIGWGGALSGTEPTETILMDEDKFVNAEFEIKKQTLTVQVPENASVDVDGTIVEGGPSVIQGFEYDRGATARIEAIIDDEYIFVHWDGTNGIVTNKVRFLAMEKDYNEVLVIEKEPFESIDHINNASCIPLTFGACTGNQIMVNDGDKHAFITDMVFDNIGSLITVSSTGEQLIILGINAILNVTSRQITQAYAYDWVAVIFLEIYPKGESTERKYNADSNAAIVEFVQALDSGAVEIWGSFPSGFDPADFENTLDSRSGIGSSERSQTGDNIIPASGVLNLNKGDRVRVRMFFLLQAGKNISIRVRRPSVDLIKGFEQ